MMSKEMYIFLKKAVKAGCNMIIAGKGGSGQKYLAPSELNNYGRIRTGDSL